MFTDSPACAGGGLSVYTKFCTPSRDYKDFKLKTYSRPFFLHSRHKTTDEIIAACTAETAAAHIPFMMAEKIDRERVRLFLMENEHKLSTKAAYASYFRKLASLYDKLVFGW